MEYSGKTEPCKRKARPPFLRSLTSKATICGPDEQASQKGAVTFAKGALPKWNTSPHIQFCEARRLAGHPRASRRQLFQTQVRTRVVRGYENTVIPHPGHLKSLRTGENIAARRSVVRDPMAIRYGRGQGVYSRSSFPILHPQLQSTDPQARKEGDDLREKA